MFGAEVLNPKPHIGPGACQVVSFCKAESVGHNQG